MKPIAPVSRSRDDRPRSPGGWAFPATVGLATILSPWPVPSTSPTGGRVASAPLGSAGARQAPEAVPIREDVATSEPDPIGRARGLIAGCRGRFRGVEDYTCTFFKRERVDGKLSGQQIMAMKARTRPASLYFQYIRPHAGREAIHVRGKNGDKIVAHDVGIARFVAGTMHLDPAGGMAMKGNRHPIGDAGIGSLIETVGERWDAELCPGESVVTFHDRAGVGDRACTMVETIHPGQSEAFLFHKVRLYVDREVGLPIRFEAYDWPRGPGLEPELVEEYTYRDLRINVGLDDRDFDPGNSRYSFGRF